jgi:hypothetical protein
MLGGDQADGDSCRRASHRPETTMPRYFFHLHCKDKAVLDPSGTELRDPDQAWDAARVTVLDLMQTQANAGNWPTCRFEVTDEAGEIVFELPFTEVVVAK